jgi:glycosyltransferase involved in cell wall biosynthesis
MNFARIEETAKGAIRRLGVVDEAQKHAVFSKTDLFCFPTYYPNEGQPLTLIEAMAHDVRIVTTRWRGIPEMLPNENVWFVEPRQPLQLATAIEAAARSPSPNGALRGLFLKSFTLKCHLSALRDALLLLGSQ